jgi:hypothetical protein
MLSGAGLGCLKVASCLQQLLSELLVFAQRLVPRAARELFAAAQRLHLRLCSSDLGLQRDFAVS